MNGRCRWALALLASLLVACGSSRPPGTLPAVVPPLPPLRPTDLLIQLDWEPTFSRPENSEPFGRVPSFTLLADGRVYYPDAGEPWQPGQEQLVVAQVTSAQARHLVQQILDLGFERLESYTDHCLALEGGLSECVMDAGFSILRVRLASGELREVKNYADYANDRQALNAIRTALMEYRNPDARPCQPEKASLFVQHRPDASGVPILDWPLDPAGLARFDLAGDQRAMVVQGDQLDSLLAVVPRNMGDCYFWHQGHVYHTYLVPWLPGADYTGQVDGYSYPGNP